MARCYGFSFCEFVVALGLVSIFFAMMAEGIFLIRNFQIFHLAATRDLLRVRYFLEVECPEILGQKKEETNSLREEAFFIVRERGVQEISQHEFDSGKLGSRDTLFVRFNWEIHSNSESANSALLPIQLRFERYLQQGKRRTYEIHTAIFLF